MRYLRELNILPQRAPSHWVFFLIAAAVAKEIEMTRNDRRQRDDRAITIDTPGNGDLSMIFVVGNSADGEQYAKQLAPHLKDLGDTHFIAYPKKGFSVDSVGDNFRSHR